MVSKSAIAGWVLVAILVLAYATWGQSTNVAAGGPRTVQATSTLTINIKGTVGPLFSGTDPLGLDGKDGSIKLVASESLSPTKHTSTSATYSLPAGAIVAKGGKGALSTKTPSTMTIKLTKTADILTLVFAGPKGLMVTNTTFLDPDSWTTAVLKNPGVFKPSSQKVTSATSAGGTGCQVEYTIDGTTTVLGFSGTASSSATVDPALPEVDLSQYDSEQ
ncbi:MAG: hypothetical protein ABSD75_28575 [Terriglobales bacterium]|jgi:hypothetical protein